jgi:hypothetical protein
MDVPVSASFKNGEKLLVPLIHIHYITPAIITAQPHISPGSALFRRARQLAVIAHVNTFNLLLVRVGLADILLAFQPTRGNA